MHDATEGPNVTFDADLLFFKCFRGLVATNCVLFQPKATNLYWSIFHHENLFRSQILVTNISTVGELKSFQRLSKHFQYEIFTLLLLY